MSTTELYSQTLADLNAVRAKLLSPEWQAKLDDGSRQERLDSNHELIKVQSAISSMSNAALSQIAKAMCDQEVAITKATADLKIAFVHLDRVGDVLSAVGTVLTIVAKIVPLV